MLDQHQRLFAAAAKDEGIAPFQPQDALALACQFDQPERNVALFRRRLAAAFSGKFQDGARLGEAQAIGVYKRIMDDDIRLAQRIGGMQGEQAGIAGTGTDQPDRARHELGKTGKQSRLS